MGEEYGVKAYDEKTRKGLVRHVLIRYGFDSGEVMVCIVVNGKQLPKESVLTERLGAIERMKSISLNTNRENTNVILGENTRVLWDILVP